MKSILLCFVICLCTISNISTQQDALADKVRQLTELSFKKPLIRINTERYNQYVKSGPRNYSIILMFTALSPQRQCGACKPAHDEFQLVAQSYRYSDAFTNKLFFGMVDFDEGAEVFQQLKLNTAPVFIHFPAKGKPKKSDQMDITRSGFAAEQLAKWIHDRSEITIQIYRPPNYTAAILGGSLLIAVATLLYFKRNSLGFLFNTIIWGFFVIFCILTCISGQIWNMIRSPPFVHQNQQTGETGLFSGSSGFQFVAETYIVFLLYFGVSIGVILLNEAPKVKSRKGKRQGIVAILGIAIVVALFSYLLSVFRAKYQGYPYSFLIK